MIIKQLPENYTHPTGVTGYTWGLYENGRLTIVAMDSEELETIVKAVTEEK